MYVCVLAIPKGKFLKQMSDLREVGGFSVYSGFLHQLNDHHDITEIFAKVALNTIQPTKPYIVMK
jgi:hypothetical protein